MFQGCPKGGAERPTLLKVEETLLLVKKAMVQECDQGKGGTQRNIPRMEQAVEGLVVIIKPLILRTRTRAGGTGRESDRGVREGEGG